MYLFSSELFGIEINVQTGGFRCLQFSN